MFGTKSQSKQVQLTQIHLSFGYVRFRNIEFLYNDEMAFSFDVVNFNLSSIEESLHICGMGGNTVQYKLKNKVLFIVKQSILFNANYKMLL